MKNCFSICLILTLASISLPAIVAADADKDDAITQDRKIYDGTWRIVSLQADGKTSAGRDIEKLTVVNDREGNWSLLADGKEVERGTSTIDPTKRPKTIDFIPALGQDKGKLCLGIYELHEHDRKLCFAGPGKGRPKEFNAPAGSGYILVTFKREKP